MPKPPDFSSVQKTSDRKWRPHGYDNGSRLTVDVASRVIFEDWGTRLEAFAGLSGVVFFSAWNASGPMFSRDRRSSECANTRGG